MNMNENDYIGALDFDVTVAKKFDGYETTVSVDVTGKEALTLKKEYLKGFNDSRYALDEIHGIDELIERIFKEVSVYHNEETEGDELDKWDVYNGTIQLETIPDEIMNFDVASSDEEWGKYFALVTYACCEGNCSQRTYSIVDSVDTACKKIMDTIFTDAYLTDCLDRDHEFKHEEENIERVNKYWNMIYQNMMVGNTAKLNDLDFEFEENDMYFRVFVISDKDEIAEIIEKFETETFVTVNDIEEYISNLIEEENILDEYDCVYNYFEEKRYENEITIIDTDVVEDVIKAFNIMTEESCNF